MNRWTWGLWGLIGLVWTGPVWADELCPALGQVAAAAARARAAGVSLAMLEANMARLDAPSGVRAAILANLHAGYFAATPEQAEAAAIRRCEAAAAQVAADLQRR